MVHFQLMAIVSWVGPLHFLGQLHSMATLASVAWSFLGKDNSLNWIFFNAS